MPLSPNSTPISLPTLSPTSESADADVTTPITTATQQPTAQPTATVRVSPTGNSTTIESGTGGFFITPVATLTPVPRPSATPFPTDEPLPTVTATSFPTPTELNLTYQLTWRIDENDPNFVWASVILTATGADGNYTFFRDDRRVNDAAFEYRWGACQANPGSFRVDSGDGQSVRIDYFEEALCP